MKKHIRILSCFLIILAVTMVGVSATSNNEKYTFQIDDTKYTVEFFDNALSSEQQEAVANRLINSDNTAMQTYGLWCTLFGHELIESKVGVITHKVRTYAPRCKEELYDVTICERCDYQTQMLSGTSYINCCPEE